MTDQRLTALEALCNKEGPWEVDGMAVPDLLAEVRRLQVENAKLWEFVETVGYEVEKESKWDLMIQALTSGG